MPLQQDILDRWHPAYGHGRRLGDLGDTLAILLIVAIGLVATCAGLGWYSRRRG